MTDEDRLLLGSHELIAIEATLALQFKGSDHDILTGINRYRFDVRLNGLSTSVALIITAGSYEDARRIAVMQAPSEIRMQLNLEVEAVRYGTIEDCIEDAEAFETGVMTSTHTSVTVMLRAKLKREGGD